jgi:hypothetical protein
MRIGTVPEQGDILVVEGEVLEAQNSEPQVLSLRFLLLTLS